MAARKGQGQSRAKVSQTAAARRAISIYSRQIKSAGGDVRAIGQVVGSMKSDRRLRSGDVKQISSVFTGARSATKAAALDAIVSQARSIGSAAPSRLSVPLKIAAAVTGAAIPFVASALNSANAATSRSPDPAMVASSGNRPARYQHSTKEHVTAAGLALTAGGILWGRGGKLGMAALGTGAALTGLGLTMSSAKASGLSSIFKREPKREPPSNEKVATYGAGAFAGGAVANVAANRIASAFSGSSLPVRIAAAAPLGLLKGAGVVGLTVGGIATVAGLTKALLDRPAAPKSGTSERAKDRTSYGPTGKMHTAAEIESYGRRSRV